VPEQRVIVALHFSNRKISGRDTGFAAGYFRPKPSRTDANDRLPADPFGRIESGDRIVEGRDGADMRSQPSAPHPLDDLAQLNAIRLDNEIDRKAVDRPCFGQPDDGSSPRVTLRPWRDDSRG
jgi:hypothetical protein